jgi:hypothetical protein
MSVQGIMYSREGLVWSASSLSHLAMTWSVFMLTLTMFAIARVYIQGRGLGQFQGPKYFGILTKCALGIECVPLGKPPTSLVQVDETG